MIVADELSRRFGPILAVDRVSFRVERGEVVGILGPNGAGKSTLMKILTGFLAPSGGTASLGGIDIQRVPVAARRRFGYLPEGAPAYPDMTPAGFLRFVAGARSLAGRKRRAAVATAVDRAGLGSVLNQPIDTLSKGFRRRVGLAAALLHDPPILILDEPTDGLDPNQKDEVRALIHAMAPDKAILISTHLLDEVEAVCSRAVVMGGGRLLADGAPGVLASYAPDGTLGGLFRQLTLPDAA